MLRNALFVPALTISIALTACVAESPADPTEETEFDYELMQQELAECADDEDPVLESDTCVYSIKGVDVKPLVGRSRIGYYCIVEGWAIWKLDAGAACDSGVDASGEGFTQASCPDRKDEKLGWLRHFDIEGAETYEEASSACVATNADHVDAMGQALQATPPNEQVQLICCVKRPSQTDSDQVDRVRTPSDTRTDNTTPTLRRSE